MSSESLTSSYLFDTHQRLVSWQKGKMAKVLFSINNDADADFRRPHMNIPTGFIDVHEAAAILFISENRLRKWVKKGKIPFHRINDHRILFKQSEIIEFIPIAWALLGRDANWTAPEPS